MALAYLVAYEHFEETRIRLGDALLLGSSAACALQIPDAAPNHVRISRCPEGWRAVDLTHQAYMSVNGTRKGAHLLRHRDILVVASARFMFVQDERVGDHEMGDPLTATPARG